MSSSDGKPAEAAGPAVLKKRSVVSTFSTGGGGFAFENLAGAWAISGMLAGATPFGTELGVPVTLRFQTAALGHDLDDLVVEGDAAARPVLSASAKSFDMLTGARILEEFIRAAWEQLLSEEFREGVDLLCLICGQAGQGNFVALQRLVTDARAEVEDGALTQRIAAEGAYNSTHRSLWHSAACPAELAARHGVDVEGSPARLLRHLLPLRLDLLAPASEAKAQALAWCQQALVPEQGERVQALWDALCTLADRLRPAGGAASWDSLLREFAGRFTFRMRPDVAPDWELLERHTARALELVRDRLGAGLYLERAEAWRAIQGAGDGPVLLLSGPSGAGKSALAKRWLQASDGPTVWLGAADVQGGLEALGLRLGLRLDLLQALELAPVGVRVVLDGLDRTYDVAAMQAAALLARRAVESDGRLRVLITCQQMELPRLARAVLQAEGPLGELVTIGDLDDQDVTKVLTEFPDVARIAVGGQLLDVLRRPKLLDLVLQAAGPEAGVLGELADETDVAKLWWQQMVIGAEGAGARAELVLQLAERQANTLAPSTPAGELGPADAERADALRADGVLDPERERYAFAHDLFGDWTRLQQLREQPPEYLVGKEQLPPWHRAIRLLALARLRAGGVTRWDQDRSQFEAEDQMLLADLYLDAVVFARDAAVLLEQLWPSLTEREGTLLRRLLARFLHVGTYPDPRGSLIFSDAPELLTHFSAVSRVPLWPLWPAVIGVLHDHRDEALEHAPKETAGIVDLWLRHSRPGWPSRRSAAELGLAIGALVIDRRTEGWHFEKDLERALYRSCLAAGADLPNEVTALLADALGVEGDAECEDRLPFE